MEPRIEKIAAKKLLGKRLRMSLSENRTASLWQSFMPRQKEIENRVSNDLISMQVYDEPLRLGDREQTFEKWAAAEVSHLAALPEGMECYILQEGLYAVFHYKGLSTDWSVFVYIFGTWLPNSEYELDARPQFEVLGEKYKNGDPNSEEEIWIPIKRKEQEIH